MNRQETSSILWRRLDSEGHDACRLRRDGEGWRLDGVAAFAEDGRACALAYAVECDAAWRTRSARVSGSLGSDAIDLRIQHTGDGWLVNGSAPALAPDLTDIDLGFTPATNLIALRRLDLAVGEESPAPAAYLVFPELRFEPIEQMYKRLDQRRYRYVSPAYAYDEVITVSSDGFVTTYPRLWQAVL
jgi:uncharacterized protein